MSVLGHVLEGAGLTTVSIALMRLHAEKVNPPRSLAVPFSYGFTLGKPDDPKFQHKVIKAAFELLKEPSGPVLVDFEEDQNPHKYLQASAVEATAEQTTRNAADEVTSLRELYERWVADHNGRTMVGLSGIPQRRFRGTIRFLEEFAQDLDADMKERPSDVSRPQFLRYCVDDLKAFYYEARMAQRPNATEEELHRWFWGDTATGMLIKNVAGKMSETEDAELKSFAFGLAR